MEGGFKKIQRRGLPGGPNETFTYTTGVFSTQGYKFNSPDYNNPFNIIASNKITMKEDDGSPLKKGPIMGVDNYGNKKIMLPGNDYQFPGDYVIEKPFNSHGFIEGERGNILGGFGISNDKFGASVFGKTPYNKERRKEWKGMIEPTLTYKPNQNLDINFSTGFEQNKTTPKVGLKYRFQPGGSVKPYKPKSQADYEYRKAAHSDSSDSYNEFKKEIDYAAKLEGRDPEEYLKSIQDYANDVGYKSGTDEFYDEVKNQGLEKYQYISDHNIMADMIVPFMPVPLDKDYDGWRLFKKPVQQILPYKPIPDKMPMRPMVTTPQILPLQGEAEKWNPEPLRMSPRGQTVLQYNPETGKHEMVERRVQQDAFWYDNHDGWQDNSQPRVYYDPETKQYSDKPFISKDKDVAQNLKFQPGGEKNKPITYVHPSRPGVRYQKGPFGWTINIPGQTDGYVPIKDPTGKRAAELNKNATPEITPEQQKGWDELGKILQKPVIKIPANMAEAQQMMDDGELPYETYEQVKARNAREAAARKQAREKSLSDYEKRTSDPNYNWLTGMPGEDWREFFANEAAPMSAQFRISQEDNFFDDYLNPLVWIGSMGQALGEAPQRAKETGSYMPYVTSIGTPLLGGALAKIGAANNKQFINNIVNPLAGVGNSLKKGIDNIYKYNPFALQEIPIKPGHSYRAVEGPHAYADYLKRGVVSSPYNNKEIIKMLDDKWAAENPNSFFNLNRQGTSPRPSFAKEKILKEYGDDAGHIFETDLPVKKSKDQHGIADFPYDPNTGKFIKEVPNENITAVYPIKPHWLKGYNSVKVPNASKLDDADELIDLWRVEPANWDKMVHPTGPKDPMLNDFLDSYYPYDSYGRWFEKDVSRLLDKRNAVAPGILDESGQLNLFNIKVPKSKLSQYNVKGTPFEEWSKNPASEYVMDFDRSVTPKITFDNTEEGWQSLANKILNTNNLDDAARAGFDGNFITKPLTPFYRTDLPKDFKTWYRKIGGNEGLQDLIDKQGAQAPGPIKMKSGVTVDNPFFGKDYVPNESYKGKYAVGVKPEALDKYGWSSWVGGVQNYGSVPTVGGRLLKNLPLEDLNVYKRKFLSNAYKKIDPKNLASEAQKGNTQEYLESAWKWLLRAGAVDMLTKGNLSRGLYSFIKDNWDPEAKDFEEARKKQLESYGDEQQVLTEEESLPTFQSRGEYKEDKTDNLLLAPSNNILVNKGLTDKQKYIKDNQYSPEIAKQQLAQQYKEEEKKYKEQERLNQLSRTITGKDYVSPESKAAREAQQKQFEKELWEDYDKMSTGEKALDRVQAAMVDPFGMTARFLTGDQAYYPGMGRGLVNPDNNNYNNYLNALGYTPGEIEAYDIGAAINPFHWGASIGNNLNKGNYGTAALEAGLTALPFLPKGTVSMGNVARGTRMLGNDVNQAVNTALRPIDKANPALRTITKAGSLNEALNTFYGIPTSKSLARLNPAELKGYRRVQEIGRMADLNKPLSERVEYGLKHLDDSDFLQVFGKAKSEALDDMAGIIERENRVAHLSGFNLTREPRTRTRTIRNVLTEPEANRFAGREDFEIDEIFEPVNNITIPDNITIPRVQYVNNLLERTRDLGRSLEEWRLANPRNTGNSPGKMFSSYPKYTGDVRETVPNLSLEGSGSLKDVSKTIDKAIERNALTSGDVFTGSTNTSHSSYLPQMKEIFKYASNDGGSPVFLGFKPMNELGYLSKYNFDKSNIANYLNSELDVQIKRGVIPKDILRPYVNKKGKLMLPHYGINKFQDGGEEKKPEVTTMEEVDVTPLTRYYTAFDEKKPYKDFFLKKQDEYLSTGNKGLQNLFGVREGNLPDAEINRIYDQYQYNRNNYAIEQYAKENNIDLTDRESIMNNPANAKLLSKAMANSKYAKYIKPSLWARTKAGAVSAANALLDGPQGVYGPTFTPDIKGLTPAEEAQYYYPQGAMQKAGNVADMFSVLDIPGAAIMKYATDADQETTLSDALTGTYTPSTLNAAALPGMVTAPAALFNAPDLLSLGLQGLGKVGQYSDDAAQYLGDLATYLKRESIEDVLTPRWYDKVKPFGQNKLKKIEEEYVDKRWDANIKKDRAANDKLRNYYTKENINKKVIREGYDAVRNNEALRNYLGNKFGYDQYSYGVSNDEDYIELAKRHRENRDDLSKYKGFRSEGKNTLISDWFEQTPMIYEQAGSLRTSPKNNEPVIDFTTGQEYIPKIEKPKSELATKIQLKDGVVRTIDNLQSGEGYKFDEGLSKVYNKNENFIKEQIPGFQSLGSSQYHKFGIGHVTSDFDGIIKAEDWNKVKNNFTQVGHAKYGPKIELENPNLEGSPIVAPEVDINIINTDPETGYATGDLAKELFRQFFPEEFYKASDEVIKKGPGNYITVNKTADELLDAYDPEIKSILDAFEAGAGYGKEKHITKTDLILELGDPDKVLKAQKLFAKVLMGKNADLGKQFPPQAFDNFDRNIELLKEMKNASYTGESFQIDLYEPTAIAKDPKRMQLALNDFYLNNSIFSRRVHLSDKISSYDDLISAFEKWISEGGEAMGIGLNSVKLGEPGTVHGDVFGNRQFKLYNQNDKKTPSEYIESIINQTSGGRIITELDKTAINKIAEKHNLKIREDAHIYTFGNLLNLRDNLIRPSGVWEKDLFDKETINLRNFLYDIGKEFGMKAISSGQYNSGEYATILGNIDEGIDNLVLSIQPPSQKSYLQRNQKVKEAYQELKGNIRILPQTEQQFKKIEGYIDGGIEVANERREKLGEVVVSLDAARSRMYRDLREKFAERNVSKKLADNDEYNEAVNKMEEARIIIEKSKEEIKAIDEVLEGLVDRRREVRNAKLRFVKAAPFVTTAASVYGGKKLWDYNTSIDGKEDRKRVKKRKELKEEEKKYDKPTKKRNEYEIGGEYGEDPKPKPAPKTIDFEGLKKGIAHVESADGKLMINPDSTATGLYGQRFSEIKNTYKGTREDFAKDLAYQNELFKKRFYEGLPATKTTSLEKDAYDLYDKYNAEIKDFSYSLEDIAALSNFLGRQGTRMYLGYVIRDGKTLAEVFPDKYGADAEQPNKTPEEYLTKIRPFYTKTKSKGGEILKVYADYINGMLDDTPMFEEGGRVYDKLNRIYYKDAKKLGMSSPNYIMTYLVNRS